MRDVLKALQICVSFMSWWALAAPLHSAFHGTLLMISEGRSISAVRPRNLSDENFYLVALAFEKPMCCRTFQRRLCLGSVGPALT